MPLIRLAIALAILLVPASDATAAGWTKSENGSKSCTKVRTNETCYVETAGENTSTISVRQCASLTVVVYATGADVQVQTCTDSVCTSSADLLAVALTGDAPNCHMTSEASFNFIRLVTTDSVTASIKCGR